MNVPPGVHKLCQMVRALSFWGRGDGSNLVGPPLANGLMEDVGMEDVGVDVGGEGGTAAGMLGVPIEAIEARGDSHGAPLLLGAEDSPIDGSVCFLGSFEDFLRSP